MPEWTQQWLTQHALSFGSLAAVVTIITGVEIFFKPLRWAIPKLWSSLSRPFKTGPKRPHVILDFVAMDFPHSQWVIGSQGDKPFTCIVTKWHVTQAPGSGVSVLLLKVHLLKPPTEFLIYSRFTIMGWEHPHTLEEGVIPEGESRILTIICNLSKVLEPEVRLKVHLAVQDQFRHKHKLPPIMVRCFRATS